ncbi:MAG: hypothetical protein M8861_03070 [marine benthic group bacterium]|nr:hypothetical protein [Gemmatimonadota bacterium]
MKKFVVAISSALLAILVAMPLSAQDITCADVSFDEQIMATYPAAHQACLEIVEVDGVRYAHFKALVHREGFPSMLLRFKHADDTWGPATLVQVPAGYRVYVDGQPAEAKDVPRGRELSFYMPEGRWQVAETEVAVVTEAEFEPLLFEVTEIELTEEVDMEAPPLVVEEAPAEAEYEAAADEAPADEVEQEAATADYEDDGAPDDSEWLWILGLAGAFIIVWFLLRRKKARREG